MHCLAASPVVFSMFFSKFSYFRKIMIEIFLTRNRRESPENWSWVWRIFKNEVSIFLSWWRRLSRWSYTSILDHWNNRRLDSLMTPLLESVTYYYFHLIYLFHVIYSNFFASHMKNAAIYFAFFFDSHRRHILFYYFFSPCHPDRNFNPCHPDHDQNVFFPFISITSKKFSSSSHSSL